MKPTLVRERRDLCIEAERLKERLFRAGLYFTGHKMDEVTKQIGYEVAALEQKKATARGER